MACERHRADREDEGGQASIALIAIIPALIVVTLALVQFALAGYAALSAGAAARAAARASYVGSDPETAARSALAAPLRTSVETDLLGRGDRAEVTVEAPSALPLLPKIPVSASAYLGPEDGRPGG